MSCHHRSDCLSWQDQALLTLQNDVLAMRTALLGIPTRLNRIERLIMASAEQLAARLDEATNEVASDLQDVKDALAAALADADAATKAAVEAELAKLDAPISRLEALGADPADPDPEGDPVVEEPAPVDQPVNPDGSTTVTNPTPGAEDNVTS